MAQAAALSSIDRHFSSTLADVFPASSASEAKGLLGEAALKLVYKQTGRAGCNQPTNEFAKFREVKVSRGMHSVAPSDKNTKPEGLGMHTALARGTPRERRNEKITKPHTAEVVSIALQAWGRDKSAPIERVRQIAGVDRSTAEAWWHGRNPPLAHHLFTLAQHIPELKAEVRRLLGLEQDHAESFQREAMALLQRYAR
jgi:hypothetical protein